METRCGGGAGDITGFRRQQVATGAGGDDFQAVPRRVGLVGVRSRELAGSAAPSVSNRPVGPSQLGFRIERDGGVELGQRLHIPTRIEKRVPAIHVRGGGGRMGVDRRGIVGGLRLRAGWRADPLDRPALSSGSTAARASAAEISGCRARWVATTRTVWPETVVVRR